MEKSLSGNVVVSSALRGAQILSTSHNSIELGKSLPGDVVVKGALCGTPKTLYFAHLQSNGKKYLFCTVLQAKTNLQLQKQAYSTRISKTDMAV